MSAASGNQRERERVRGRVRAYVVAVAGVGLASLLGWLADGYVTAVDQAMLYLPIILLAALGGRAPSLVAAALSVAAYDFFFVPPRLTFAVSDQRSLITFAVMFVVGAATGALVVRLRTAEAASRERERRTAALLAFTRDAAGASDAAEIVRAAREHIERTLGVTAIVTIPDERPLQRAVSVEIAGPALSAEPLAFIDAVARQAGVAIGRIQLAETAREAALRAKAEELRATLLSSVSHDLRTPLAAITGMATALRDRRPADREALDTIVEEAQRLGRILTNLLSITKVESGAAPRREWVPLEELVGSARVRLAAELADHPIEVDVPPSALANVDPILAEQLLLNLLENAAKHTPAGTPIAIRVERAADRAILEVADRGQGVPAGAADRVFEKFYRGTTAAPGVGLGLAVCRAIATAHHGTIEAKPRDGGGARFIATFPDETALPTLDDDALAAEAR